MEEQQVITYPTFEPIPLIPLRLPLEVHNSWTGCNKHPTLVNNTKYLNRHYGMRTCVAVADGCLFEVSIEFQQLVIVRRRLQCLHLLGCLLKI